jgi:hypothetical protein
MTVARHIVHLARLSETIWLDLTLQWIMYDYIDRNSDGVCWP